MVGPVRHTLRDHDPASFPSGSNSFVHRRRRQHRGFAYVTESRNSDSPSRQQGTFEVVFGGFEVSEIEVLDAVGVRILI